MKKEEICAKIVNDLKNELHWSLGQCAYVYEILGPLGYTRDYDTSNRANSGKPELENLNAIPLDELKSLDDERLRQFIKKSKADTDHALFEATDRGLAVVDHDERESKISTELPTEMETDYSISFFDIAEQAQQFIDSMISIGKKVKQFPPQISKEENREWAMKNRAIAQMFYGWNQRILPSLHDLKYAFSEFEWFKTLVKEENYSKHGAAVKSKIQAVDKDGNPTGEYRPLTREVVGDNKEEVTKDLENALVSFDIFAWLNNAVEWHDIKGQVAQRVAQRRIKLGPKLSSTAFGADSGKEFHDV